MSKKRSRDVPSPPASPLFKTNMNISPNVSGLLDRLTAERRAVTFDDVTLEDQPSEVHPNDVDLTSYLTRKTALKAGGCASAAMDTVTERELALALAKSGGIGVLHRNLTVEDQCAMVKWVRMKIHFGGMIERPICFRPEERLSEMQAIIKSEGYTFTSFPVTSVDGTLLGLLTRDEIDFVEDSNPTLDQIMKKRPSIVTAKEGTTSEDAYRLMTERKVKKLPIVDDKDKLLGLYVWNDCKADQRQRGTFSLDDEGHFLVAAAIGLGPEDPARADALVRAGCRILVLDSSHGACQPARDLVAHIRRTHGNAVELIVGNIASYASARYLLDSPYLPDALKVGIGGGSICSTKVVTGHGVPQLMAVYQVAKAVRDAKVDIPVIADGGIRNSGDMVKCYAAGASSVMLGSVLAGTLESPSPIVQKGGRRWKRIRGMGSRSAMAEREGSRARYHRQDTDQHKADKLTEGQKSKIVPEGVEGLVELKGSVESVMAKLLGGVQSGLAHSGSRNIREFQSKAGMWTQSVVGTMEGKPHSIQDIHE